MCIYSYLLIVYDVTLGERQYAFFIERQFPLLFGVRLVRSFLGILLNDITIGQFGFCKFNGDEPLILVKLIFLKRNSRPELPSLSAPSCGKSQLYLKLK